MRARGASCSALLDALSRGVARLPRPLATAAAVVWMVAIHVLSSGRRDFLPPSALGQFATNAAHGPLFGVLAILAARATASPAVGLAASVLYGAADEWHQSFVPGRHASPLDLATDAAGATVALWLVAAQPASRVLAERVARLRVLGAALAIGVVAALATWLDA